MSHLQIQNLSPSQLKPYPGNARTHSRKQRQAIAKSIKRFGFTNPILVNDQFEIIAGHGRWLAARDCGLQTVPVVVLSSMSEADRRAYIIADNKLAELARWDGDLLAVELQGLLNLQYDDLELTGFSLGEIDTVLDDAAEKAPIGPGPDDLLPPESTAPVTRPGDCWRLGRHKLVCGDALFEGTYPQLMDTDCADLVLTDPPYNVAIAGNVSGLGKVKHKNFAMASGEMSEAGFTDFLSTFLRRAVSRTNDGSILFVFMDWRHVLELTLAGRNNDLALKNLIVWSKDNAGMGTFYRSKHELCFAFKTGSGPHTNTFELGQHGRHRTNVWEYAGVNTFRNGRADELTMHPTVKPVAMLADAIKDVTKRNAIVLDPFGGSGSTLIAAEKTGRRARMIELDPRYCDVIIRRWQNYTGKQAILEATDQSFEEIESQPSLATDLDAAFYREVMS